MRSVSEPICSRMGPRAGKSASGMCSGALLWKLLAGHFGRRAPKDLTAPRTWFTSWVRLLTSACLDGDAHRRSLLRSEAPLRDLRGGAQPALLDHLTAYCVDEAQVGVFVAEIEPGCDL